jgi:hypothetical protein
MADVAIKPARTKPLIQQFENAEKDDHITLNSLRRVTDALGCTFVYAVVPKTGTLTELVERGVHDQVVDDVHAVERTMALEDQAVGDCPVLGSTPLCRSRTVSKTSPAKQTQANQSPSRE